ncbi:unnamed protein product [Sphenostylis stenocarpa]|uniref:UBL3-like ubiquitin domain-containing protein n=1 Tax=Sphenostylis stenocarpa TaxID=92480 RepID=A0AA86VBQ0_9FABA|nr:unnamed protein product [Sphenostylis stenocarpa]
MPEEDLVDIKFRLYDGSDIGPFRYSSAATVDMLKQRIVSDWPKGGPEGESNLASKFVVTGHSSYGRVGLNKLCILELRLSNGNCDGIDHEEWLALEQYRVEMKLFEKGKTVVPKSANEVKLISSGKILENNRTVGQCKVPFGEIAGSVIIMHVVVQPSLAKTKAGKYHGLLALENINNF